MPFCKKCHQSNFRKAGITRGQQRYKCKSCSCHFTLIDRRGKTPEEEKALAILLYSQGKSSFGFIGKLLNKSRSTVYRWTKKAALALPEPIIDPSIQQIEIDEMWHFSQRKKTKSGSLKL